MKVKNTTIKGINSIIFTISMSIQSICTLYLIYPASISLSTGIGDLSFSVLMLASGIVVGFSAILSVVMFYLPRNFFISTFMFYFLFVYTFPFLIGSVISKVYFPYDANKYYIFILLSIIIASLLWFLFYFFKIIISKNILLRLEYMQIVVQIGICILTVIGVSLNFVEELIFKDFAVFYAIILALHLFYNTVIQYFIVSINNPTAD